MTSLSISSWLPLLLLGAPAACTGAANDSDSRHPGRWTLDDISAALAANAPFAVEPNLPDGLLPAEVLTAQTDGTSVLNVTAAFAESQPAAYVMTDVWLAYDAVWAQPWYFLITAWNAQSPFSDRLKDANGVLVPGLFDVPPTSGFYSPFWLVEYAEAPAGADPANYQSTRTLLDDNLVLHPTSGSVYAIHPAGVGLTKPAPTHPILGTALSGFSDVPAAFCDGTSYPYFFLGSGDFTFDQQLAVDEVPLFRLATRSSSGGPQPLAGPLAVGALPIAGVGPLLSGQPAQQGASGPRLKSYYRITWAFVPATAAVFDPIQYPAAAALIAATSGDPANPTDPRLYSGRVALNAFGAPTATVAQPPACFASASFPASCHWLDSQAHVESLLGAAALLPTMVTVAAPTVLVAAPSPAK